MRIVVAYTTVVGGPVTANLAARFVVSWTLYPGFILSEAQGPHSLQVVIVCNGGALDSETASLFLGLDPQFFVRENDPSWDIGGYMDVARNFPCDLLVCCGESVFFHRAGWLSRLVEVAHEDGPGMYGVFSSNLLRPHLNTTMFAVLPRLLLGAPRPLSREDRHNFEHGPNAFWVGVTTRGFPVRLVTWDGDYGPEDWRKPANIMWKGDQSNCLAFCVHTERYADASEETKRLWGRNADRGAAS